jgi:hypothetical protein
VRAALQQHLVARIGEHVQADLVGHGAGGHEEGGLGAQPVRHAGLEPVDGRVFPVHVVADLGLGHGSAHPVGRARDGVAAKIDHGRGAR